MAYGHSVCALAARAGLEPAAAGAIPSPGSATELPRRIFFQKLRCHHFQQLANDTGPFRGSFVDAHVLLHLLADGADAVQQDIKMYRTSQAHIVFHDWLDASLRQRDQHADFVLLEEIIHDFPELVQIQFVHFVRSFLFLPQRRTGVPADPPQERIIPRFPWWQWDSAHHGPVFPGCHTEK